MHQTLGIPVEGKFDTNFSKLMEESDDESDDVSGSENDEPNNL